MDPSARDRLRFVWLETVDDAVAAALPVADEQDRAALVRH
jgi:hypothetical protein